MYDLRRLREATISSTANKPILILVVFACLYKYRARSKESQLDKLEQAAKDPHNIDTEKNLEIQHSDETVLWIPYKDGTKKIVVKHIDDSQFDKDASLFRKGGSFAAEARALLRVLFPQWNCRSMHYLVIHMVLLTLRTYFSLIVAELDGRIVRSLMSANAPEFFRGLVEWFALGVPACYTNALIKYFESKIALTFRTTLIRYIHDLYVGPNQEYYKIGSLDGELEDIDHYIASDVTRFCLSAARLYSSLGKPFLDLSVFSVKLARNLGTRATLGIFLNYFVTATILKTVSPSFGKLAARETRLEGDYRNAHSRVITNAEEIAFYDGAEIEKQSLSRSFTRLQHHIAKQIKTKAWYSVIENYVLKYSWSASGFLFASIPVFFPDLVMALNTSSGGGASGETETSKEHQNMGKFVTNKRMMLSVSDAGGRIMYSIKDLAELSSHTRRVFQLIAALFRVRSKQFANVKSEKTNQNSEFTMADVQGKFEITTGAGIKFTDVPIVVPGHGCDMSNGELLLSPLTFEVKPQEHLLIVGSNGTGKTSIARLAAGMWPVYRGLLQRSPDVTFLPQRPYFSYGTLRDQVIYPQTHYEMLQNNKFNSDEDILRILERVNLKYLPEREGGLGALKEWKDVLSGGEKQRLMFARILYTNPKFAVIDEGTSAVSADMEGQLYEECKKNDITLLTITHRISLLKYHSAKLEVGLGDDNTGWSYETVSKKGWQSLDTEISQLEKFLAEVPKLEVRRQEIAAELS